MLRGLVVSLCACLLATDARSQLASCDPADAFRAGIPSQFTADQFAQLTALSRQAERQGTPLPPGAASFVAPQYMYECIRNRYSVRQKVVSDLVNRYQSEAVATGFGRWVAGMIIPKAVSSIAQKIGVEAIEPVVEIAGLSESVSKFIAPDESLIDKALTVAFAEAELDARKTGSATSAVSVMRWLNAESEMPTSPLFKTLSNETKELLLAEARKRVVSIELMDPDGAQSLTWFDETLAESLGLGKKPTSDMLREQRGRLRGPEALTLKERARKQEIDKGVTAAMAQARAAQAAAGSMLSDGTTVTKAAQTAELAYSQREIWTAANSALAASGVDSRDPNAVGAFAGAQKAKACSADSRGLECATFSALKLDADFRIGARQFAGRAKATAEVADLAVLSLRAIGASPELTRAFSAISVSAKSASAIADIVSAASGALTPMGWVGVATQLLQGGGALGEMFGSSGPDPDAERQKQVMEALASLSRQVDQLRQITLDKFARQEKQLVALAAFNQANLALLQSLTEWQGYRQCSEIAEYASAFSIDSGASLSAAMLSTNSTISNVVADCAGWLARPRAVVDLRDGGRLNELFSVRLDVLQKTLNDLNADAGSLSILSDELARRKGAHASLLRLTTMGLPMNAVSGPYAPGKIGPTLFAPSTPKQLEYAMKALVPASVDHPVEITEMPELLGGLGKQVFGPASRVMLSETVSQPLNTMSIARVLQAALLIRGIEPYLARDGASYRRPAQIDPKRAELDLDAVRPNDWTWELLPLAYAAIAHESMYRGDYAIPLISEILESTNVVEACVPAPRDPASTDICKRFGKNWLDQLLNDARDVVRSFPEVRNNIALWRTQKSLEAVSAVGPFASAQEDTLGKSFRPMYGYAFAHPNAQLLRKLLPKMMFFPIETPADSLGVASELEKSGRWVMHLSGECSGFRDIALNGKVVCENGICEGAQVEKNEYGVVAIAIDKGFEEPVDNQSDEYATWRSKVEKMCVVAPLPNQERLESGQFASRVQYTQVVPIAQSFISTVSHYLAIERAASVAKVDAQVGWDSIVASTLMRPPRVPLLRPSN